MVRSGKSRRNLGDLLWNVMMVGDRGSLLGAEVWRGVGREDEG